MFLFDQSRDHDGGFWDDDIYVSLFLDFSAPAGVSSFPKGATGMVCTKSAAMILRLHICSGPNAHMCKSGVTHALHHLLP